MNEAIWESRRKLAVLFNKLELQACLDYEMIQGELWGKGRKKSLGAVKARKPCRWAQFNFLFQFFKKGYQWRIASG